MTTDDILAEQKAFEDWYYSDKSTGLHGLSHNDCEIAYLHRAELALAERARVEPYLCHQHGCKSMLASIDKAFTCTCGLDAILAEWKGVGL